MDIWASYGWLCRSQWVSEADPPELVEPEAKQKHCNEQTYKRLRGAPSRACATVIPRAETSASVGVRGNAATNKPETLVQQDSGTEKKNRNKVADEREISMDYVAIPASYEPPGFEPTPPELQAGWLSTIAPRRCAKRGRREACRRRRRLHARRRASNLCSPGRSTRALPVYYADDVKNKRHQTHHYTLPGTYGRQKWAHYRR